MIFLSSVLAPSCLNTLHRTKLYDILSFWAYFVDLAQPSLSHVRAGSVSSQNNSPITVDNIASIWNPRASIQQSIQHSATTQKQPHSTRKTKTAWNTNQYKIDFAYRSMDLRHGNRNTVPKNNVSISTWCNPAEWTPLSLTLNLCLYINTGREDEEEEGRKKKYENISEAAGCHGDGFVRSTASRQSQLRFLPVKHRALRVLAARFQFPNNPITICCSPFFSAVQTQS